MTPFSFIVVSGPPASGKSTVAVALAHYFRIPVLAKDDCKEELFDAENCRPGGEHRELSRRACEIALRRAARSLERGESLLLEGNWRAADHGAAIAALAARYGPRVLQVQCIASGERLLARFVERARSGSRHAVHADLDALPRLRDELLRGSYEPLPLAGALLTIDTTAGPLDGAAWIASAAALLQP